MYIEIPGYIFFWCDPQSAVKIIIIKNLSKTDAVDGSDFRRAPKWREESLGNESSSFREPQNKIS